MLITFVGTEKGNNGAKKAATLAAALLSLSNNKKVCLMQLDYDTKDMVSLLVGKMKNEGVSEKLDTLGTSEIMSGIDALISKANTASVLTADSLYAGVEAMVTTENRFDVLSASRKENFDAEIASNSKFAAFKRAISFMTSSEADSEVIMPYDYVIMFVPYDCPRLGEIIAMSDLNVCCVRQDLREEPMLNEKNNVFLITHYDANSVYDSKFIKKAYSKDTTKAPFYVMPHNVGFKDACIAMELRRWIVKNYNVSEEDDNYDFINKMQKFVNRISNSEAVDEAEPSAKKRKKEERKGNTKVEKLVEKTKETE